MNYIIYFSDYRHNILTMYITKFVQWAAEELERRDPRGRTPLLLGVTLGRLECVRVLLAAGADVCCESDGWTAVQEATARGDSGLLAAVLARRDHARHAARAAALPALLRRLSLAPDFYVEMKWEFTSWGQYFKLIKMSS